MVSKIPNDRQEDVKQLREWYSKQPHLPQDLGDKVLLQFLHSCYYRMEETKKTIDLFFSIRVASPELLLDRDPLSSHMQYILSIIDLAKIDMPDNRNLWIWKLNDSGLEKYDFVLDIKLFFLVVDSWLLQEQPMVDEDIAILDIKDINIKYLTRFNLFVAKKFIAYQEGAVPIRLKQIHLINCPPVIDTIYGLFKPFLKQELRDAIHFHYPKSSSLFDFIEKKCLPEDFGGDNGTMKAHMKIAMELLMSKRDILIDNDFWKCSKKANGGFEEDAGTFRRLDID